MTHTSEQLINRIGRGVVASKVGVGLTAVSNAAVRGKIPASWYASVKRECDRLGIGCPTDLFSFKQPSSGAASTAQSSRADGGADHTTLTELCGGEGRCSK